LEEMSLVKKTHQGRIVAQFSLEFLDIYELRTGIEIYGILLGVVRATDADLEEIEALIAKTKQAFDQKDYDNLRYINSQFHDLLVGCSKNKKIIDTFLMLAKQVRRACRSQKLNPQHLCQRSMSFRQHI
jgi:DNA-binding GntR family transcriptional regulator